MRRTIGIGGIVACAALVLACDSSTDTNLSYAATMTGAKERPNPVTSNGTGSFTGTLDANNVMTYSFSWSGLNGNTNNSHIHGPATTEQAAGVLIDFNNAAAGRIITFGSPSGTASGTIDFKVAANANVSADSLKKLLDLGLLYVNIHSTTSGGGEIRGQITRQ